MKVKYSIVEIPSAAPPVLLKSVWLIDADKSYDIKKNDTDKISIVALRTLRGLGKIQIEGQETIEVLPGTLLFFKRNMVRRYYCSSEQWNFRWYDFHPGAGFSIPMDTVFHVNEKAEEKVLSNECLKLLQNGSDGSDRSDASKAEASAVFSLLVSKWLSQLEYAGNTNINSNSYHSNPYKSVISQIVLRLNTNLSENMTIKQMAAIAGLCERRFHDVFVQAMDVSPKKYLGTLKIKGAQELLKNTSLSIGEISLKLGYSSQFHFCSAFKKVKNVSPSQYRNSNY